MPVVLQGSLQHFDGKELLEFLGRHNGTLEAESGGQHLRVLLRNGCVVWAEGGSDASSVVAELLGWSDGAFNFLDEVVLPEGVAPLAIEIDAIVADAEARIAMMSLYPDENIKFRVVNKPPGEISLRAEEFQVLFQIGKEKTLGQLRTESGRPAVDLYPIVRRLQSNGLIEVLSDSGATARGNMPAPPPPPATPAPGPPKTIEQEPSLIGTLTADDGTMHPLLEEISTIGRTKVNTIALSDPSVSAHHARVDRTDDGFVIEDIGSRNGTYINSEKLAERRLLADGDLVRFGKVILTFNLAADLKRKQSTEREMMT